MKFGFRNWFTRRDGMFLVTAALVVGLYVAVGGGGFPLDDSWIHQTYGQNLARTGQWAFVPGTPSAASTSPLYTVMLAIGYLLNVPYLLWTHTLGILVLTGTAMLGARLAEQLAPKTRAIGAATGLALILAWHLIWAAASGMETAFFGMWTLALIWLAWQELSKADAVHSPRRGAGRGGLFGGLAALTTLTRPEGILLVGLIGSSLLIVRPQGSWRSFWIWSAGAVVGFLIVIAPYALLNLQLTGGLLPNTAAAKQAEQAALLYATYPERIINLLFPLIAGGQLLLFPGMVHFAVAQLHPLSRTRVFHLLPLLWAMALIGLYAARLPAPYQHGRYVMPALPALIVIGMVGTAGLMQWGRSSLIGRVVTRSLAISAALSFLYFGLVAGPPIYRVDVAIINEEMVTTAHWIADNLPLDQLLAVHDIGAVGYFASRPILDLAGLVSPEVIPIILDEPALWNLLQEQGARYLMAFPDQIPGKDNHDPHLCLLYSTGGKTSRSVGGPNMAVYALTWNGSCPAALGQSLQN